MDSTKRTDILALFQKQKTVFPLLLFVIPFTLYWVTAPRTVTMEDSGLFILNAFHLGLNHPTGYPLHTLLGKIFILFGPGAIAFRVHLLSMIAASTAVVLVYFIGLRLETRRYPAFLASLCLAFSSTFWYQAIVAEVYMLTAALFLAVFLAALRLEKEFDRRGWYLFCFLLGLSTTAHLSLAVFAFPAVFFLLWKRLRNEQGILWKGFLFFCLGLTPHLHLILAPLYTEYIFEAPLRTPGEIIDFLTRKNYRPREGADAFSFLRILTFSGVHLAQMIREYHPVLFVASLAGILLAVRRWKSTRVFAVLWLLLYTLLILFFWRKDPSPTTRELWRNFHLLPAAALALFFAVSLDRVYVRATTKTLRWLFTCLGVFGVSGLILVHWNENDLRRDTFADEHARIVLESLPPGAMLVVYGGAEPGPFAYLNEVLGVREDVTVVNQENTIFPDRILDKTNSTPLARVIRSSQVFRSYLDRERRVFHTYPLFMLQGGPALPYHRGDSGLLYEILRPGERGYGLPASTLSRSRELMDRYVAGKFPKNFQSLRSMLLLPHCRLYVQRGVSHPVQDETECLFSAAEELSEAGKYSPADEKFLRIIHRNEEHPPFWNTLLLYSFLQNRLRMIESAEDMLEDRKRSLLQEGVDVTIQNVQEGGCSNPVLFLYRDLIERRDLRFDREFVSKKMADCSIPIGPSRK